MTTLSDSIADGIGNARFTFGRGNNGSASECLASGLQRFSAEQGSGTVGVVMTNDRPTVEMILGAIFAGVRLVSVPLPPPSSGPTAYLKFVTEACEAQGVERLVARDDIAKRLSPTGLSLCPHSELEHATLSGPSSGGFELVQFSSGSTDRPKAVCLTDAALGANVRAVMETVRPEPGDNTVSWLPLSHDMGLIGMFLTSTASASPEWVGPIDIVLLEPAQFLRNPSVWLNALSEWRGTFTASPDFGYRLCVERGKTDHIELGPLRCAIVGGEPVRASTLTEFADRYGRDGFRSTALCPAYGLAEIGLAATITPVRSPWRELSVDTLSLAERRLVYPEPDSEIRGSTTRLVSSGPPITGEEVHCDADPEGLGSVWVRGPSAGSDGTTGRSFAGDDGWVKTGDIGACVDGWLYVSGRGDDHIVTRARSVYAPAVEAAVGKVQGIRSGRVAAVGLPSGDWIVMAEPRSTRLLTKSGRASITRDIRRAVVKLTAASPSMVVLVPRGRLPYTASGKLQRSEAVRRYLSGEID